MNILLFILTFIFALPFALLLVDARLGTSLSCKYFGWHDGKSGVIEFDGVSRAAHCSKCHSRVLQDSQGNWFSIT